MFNVCSKLLVHPCNYIFTKNHNGRFDFVLEHSFRFEIISDKIDSNWNKFF